MTINDFNISVRTIGRINPIVFAHECMVVSKENNVRFGIVIQNPQPPPIEWVYNTFLTNRKDFFIDIDATKTSQPVVVHQEPPTTTSGSI